MKQPYFETPPKITVSITATCNLDCETCYADCNRPDWAYWGDSYKPQSAHSAAVKAYTANTTQCKTLGRMLYAFGRDWRPACKP